MEDDKQRLPPPVPHQQLPLPQQRVLVAQQPDTTTIDLTAAPRVTWHDQQQLPANTPPPLPPPQQRVNLRHPRSPCRVKNNLRLSHHPLGPPSISPQCVAQHLLYHRLLVQLSTIRPLQTALPTSLPVSTNSKMNSVNLGPTTLLIDDTLVRPF